MYVNISTLPSKVNLEIPLCERMTWHAGFMAKPTTKSPVRHEMVMGQLMEAAERLFAEKGFAGTSLQELADAVGLTRTGIYHYISGKDALLEELVRGFTVETAQELRSLASASGRPAVDRLREGVYDMAVRVARHPQRFRLLLNSEGGLTDTVGKQYRKARRDTLTSLHTLVSASIDEGDCRPVDPELAAFALAGVSNWVAFWYPRRDGAASQTPDAVARQLADIALGGLLSRRTDDSGGVAHALDLLREDVARLDHLLSHSDPAG
ncbi:MAG: hypothetical protein QOH34_230 [Mycobacterium sp.]|jgi:AcrR family transcriptional regulator|nr:hypothetical protein [Mycobacterium sp.]